MYLIVLVSFLYSCHCFLCHIRDNHWLLIILLLISKEHLSMVLREFFPRLGGGYIYIFLGSSYYGSLTVWTQVHQVRLTVQFEVTLMRQVQDHVSVHQEIVALGSRLPDTVDTWYDGTLVGPTTVPMLGFTAYRASKVWCELNLLSPIEEVLWSHCCSRMTVCLFWLVVAGQWCQHKPGAKGFQL